MDAAFWEERWATSRIGFHEGATNRQLARYWDTLAVPDGERVFVPLAGKTLDILWLLQRYRVLANELSATAATAFFAENDIAHTETDAGPLRLYTADGLAYLQGDFFDVPAAELGSCAAVFDRAALVALPPAMRQRYAAKMTEALNPGAQMLLITLEYDQQLFDGPPFALQQHDVEQLYGGRFEIEKLGGEEEAFRGTTVVNRAYRLQKT